MQDREILNKHIKSYDVDESGEFYCNDHAFPFQIMDLINITEKKRASTEI